MKVLVVDDRIENVRYLQELLQRHGFEVATALHGLEALRKVRQERIDLVVSDIMMPDMDGFQLCQAIKNDKALRHIPFIFHSATYTTRKDEDFARSLGADEYIVKPVPSEELVSRVRAVIKDASAGRLHAAQKAIPNEVEHLRQYNARLVQKLEDKILEAEDANRRLRELNLELERRVEERTSRLQAVNKELEAFAYSVSHDLRAPLRALEGLSGILIEDYARQLDESGRRYLERIVKAARQMDALIQDLLTYSRIARTEIHPGPVSIERVIDEACGQLAAEIKETKAEVAVQPGLPWITGHHVILVQVFANLLSNGIKFVKSGVRPRLAVTAETRGNQVRVLVRDNGIGIAPEFQERIFSVFERLHGSDSYPGTGVGLAIVRKGVERLGGQTGVESALGEGSCFWLELPAAGSAEVSSQT